MPKITIEGRTQGGQAPMFGKPYQQAAYDNANFDRSQRRYDKMTGQEYDQTYDQARAENQQRDTAERLRAFTERQRETNARQEATYINNDHRLRETSIRQEATYVNNDHRLRETNLRREAEYMNSEHRAKETNIRQEALYINRDLDAQKKTEDQRYRRDRAEAEYINANTEAVARSQRREAEILNAAMGGGGGRGGGRGGGGGYVPFAGGMGFGSTASFGAAALSGGLTAYLGVKALEELAFAPQAIGSIAAGALSSSTPIINLKRGTYAAGRAGGFGGEGLYRGLFPGSGITPDWMAERGMGPGTAFGAMQSLGIAPSSAEQGIGMARGLGSLQFMPGLSGLAGPGGMSDSPIMQTLAKYGMMGSNEDSILKQGSQLSKIMEDAVARGANRAEVLRSIDTAVSTSAHAGLGGMRIEDLYRSMMQFSALPGGRTGEAGLAAMSGLNAASDTVGSDPLRTVMASRFAQKYSTEDKLKTRIDQGNPGRYAALRADPVTSRLLDDYYSEMASGNTFIATQILNEIIKNQSDMQTEEFGRGSGMYGGQSQGTYDVSFGRVSGLGTRAGVASQIGPQGDIRTTLGGRLNNPLNLTYAPGQPFAAGKEGKFGRYNSMVEGVAGAERQLLRYQDVYKLNTIRGIISRWAPPNENDTEGYIAGVSGEMGVKPDAPVDLHDPEQAAKLISAMSKRETKRLDPGTVAAGVRLGLGKDPGSGGLTEQGSFAGGTMSQGGVAANPSIPDAYRTPAQAEQLIYMSSAASFAEMNTLLPVMSKAVQDAASAADWFSAAVTKATKTMDEYRTAQGAAKIDLDRAHELHKRDSGWNPGGNDK